uniref:Uncharacterized protein n=1 Tax=Anguilla anguilla TaxID=7936 RepID=A0A0E9SP04_ANGAN
MEAVSIHTRLLPYPQVLRHTIALYPLNSMTSRQLFSSIDEKYTRQSF